MSQRCRARTCAAMFGLLAVAAPAGADWLTFEMKGEARTIGTVEAVDSWFTTLATLLFEMDGLAPGTYAVVMLDQAGCAQAAAGQVYRRAGDAPTAPTGALGELVVAPDGTTTRTLSIKPDRLNDASEKLTVTEMRGHALVFRAVADASAPIVACGAIPIASLVDPAS